jgi:hypothetical protein
MRALVMRALELVTAAALLAVMACGGGETVREAAPRRRLHHAARSPEELVDRVLAAVEASDLATLTDLRVDEREHNELLWPEFPARNQNVQLAFAWANLNTRSHTNARRAISTWGGQELARTALRFERGIASYPTFELHNGTAVDAQTPDGREVELRFLGSLLELDGQWKVLSYKD